ncbi:MAG: hypothetical protein WAV20_09310 [Blastocatellia bacterium]
MQRLNRPAHAPGGMAFFIFLGLAILPVSLRVAGVQTNFSPRLSAAVDAWKQIAGIGSSYEMGTDAALPVLNNSTVTPSNEAEENVATHRFYACTRQVQQAPPASQIQATTAVFREPLRVVSSRSIAAHRQARRTMPVVATAEIKATLEKHTRVLESLRAIKPETLIQEAMLKRIETEVLLRGFETRKEIKTLPIPQSLRSLIRLKPAFGVPSATRSAQCKVRAAMASARTIEREGPVMTGSLIPDNSEF